MANSHPHSTALPGSLTLVFGREDARAMVMGADTHCIIRGCRQSHSHGGTGPPPQLLLQGLCSVPCPRRVQQLWSQCSVTHQCPHGTEG